MQIATATIGSRLEPHVRAHEAVHAARFSVWQGGAAAASVGELETEAEAGAREITAGRTFAPTLGAPAGVMLHWDPPTILSDAGPLPHPAVHLDAPGGIAPPPARPNLALTDPMMDADVSEVRSLLDQTFVSAGEESRALFRLQKWDSRDRTHRDLTGYEGVDYLDRFLFKLRQHLFNRGTVFDDWVTVHDLMFYELEGSRRTKLQQLVDKSRQWRTNGPVTREMEGVGSYVGERVGAGALGIVNAGAQGLAGLADIGYFMATGTQAPNGGLAGEVGRGWDEIANALFSREVLEEESLLGLNSFQFGSTFGKVPYALATGQALAGAGIFGQLLAVGGVGQGIDKIGTQISKLRAAGMSWSDIARQGDLWAQAVGVVAGLVGVRGGPQATTAVQQSCQAMGLVLDAAQAGALVVAYQQVDNDLTLTTEAERARKRADLLAGILQNGASYAKARYGQAFEDLQQREPRGAPQLAESTSESPAPATPDYHQRQAAMEWSRRAAELEQWATQQRAQSESLRSSRGETASENALTQARMRASDGTVVVGVATAEAQAAALRSEAGAFHDGTSHPLADLDDAAINQIVGSLEPEGDVVAEIFVQRGMQRVEGRPDVIRRLAQSTMSGAEGRWVFRVQGGEAGPNRSVDRIAVDGTNNVSISGSTPLNLNAGNAETALDWLRSRGGDATLVAFQVDEAFIRSVRSAAIPEHHTGDIDAVARQVDIHHGDDQLQLSAEHIGRLEDNIVPGSGVVISMSQRSQD